ncbi:hypothetical protein ACEPAG_8495 [Sanghuangporus baumii]
MAFLLSVELSVWAIVSFILAMWSSVLLILTTPNTHFEVREYSWIEDDFPPVYPLALENVAVMPEDTTHYQIYAADGYREWETQFPSNGGYVELGPQNRTFQLTVFHELRCLGLIRDAVAAQSFGEEPKRLHNCFNYLRELILCRADVTLEEVLDEQHSVNHMFLHVCRDWEALYTAIRNHG